MDAIEYTETIYSDRHGHEHRAVMVTWAEIQRVLGHEHSGVPADDSRLVDLLLAAGAPEWVRDAEGWVEEQGWGLIRPAEQVTDHCSYGATRPRLINGWYEWEP